MVYRHFRLACIWRVFLLGITIYFFIYLLTRTSFYALTFMTGLIILYEIYSLIHFVEKTNRDLSRFLDAVKYEDFSQSFSGLGLGSSFNDLKEAFNEVLRKFQRTRTEKEEHYRYLHTVVQHVGIGLISFQQEGDISLINKAARQLLRVPQLRNIKSLEGFSKELVDTLLRMKAGERSIVRVEDNDEILQLVIHATEFVTQEEKYTLVSIQNLQSELEEKEMEAWQNLIRVLTHEIMNSVTPIASLAASVKDLLGKTTGEYDAFASVDSETVEDIQGAVQTIEKRSQGLLHFVESYRKLTRLPKPNFKIFLVSSLFDRVRHLMDPEIAAKGMRLTVSVEPETLELTADPELIEQVLINLLMNSVQALEGRPEAGIELKAGMNERGRVIVQVADNGPGILKEVQEKIFIPFFTTKHEGSGIGLSLSRQIMRLHRGTISVCSEPEVETVFTLRF
jgi:nitrogen fixation/metabolism regulation signal transduction histidine kinase